MKHFQRRVAAALAAAVVCSGFRAANGQTINITDQYRRVLAIGSAYFNAPPADFLQEQVNQQQSLSLGSFIGNVSGAQTHSGNSAIGGTALATQDSTLSAGSTFSYTGSYHVNAAAKSSPVTAGQGGIGDGLSQGNVSLTLPDHYTYTYHLSLNSTYTGPNSTYSESPPLANGTQGGASIALTSIAKGTVSLASTRSQSGTYGTANYNPAPLTGLLGPGAVGVSFSANLQTEAYNSSSYLSADVAGNFSVVIDSAAPITSTVTNGYAETTGGTNGVGAVTAQFTGNTGAGGTFSAAYDPTFDANAYASHNYPALPSAYAFGGLNGATQLWDLNLSTGEPNSPTTLTFNYDPDQLPAGSTNHLFVDHLVNNVWKLEDAIFDTTNHTFTITVNSFSPILFVTDVTGTPEPSACAGIVLTSLALLRRRRNEAV